MNQRSRFTIPTFLFAGVITMLGWQMMDAAGAAAVNSPRFWMVLGFAALIFAPWFALLAFTGLSVRDDDFVVRRLPWAVRMAYADVAAVEAGVGGFFPHPRAVIKDKNGRRAFLDYDAFHERDIGYLLRAIRHHRPDLTVPSMPPRYAHLR